MEGSKLNNWTLVRLISNNSGNGEVREAMHCNGRTGAIKVLMQFTDPKKAIKRKERFLQEIKKLEALRDSGFSGVMPIYESGVTDENQPWFAMPLATPLNPKGNRVEWAYKVVLTVAECVANLHTEGMVHRDIKPSNILELDDKVVLSDFGLARETEDFTLTTTGEIVGSFGYVAPECKGHADEPQFKCDVYALAKTAWVLFTGERFPPQGELNVQTDSFITKGVISEAISLDKLFDLLVAATTRDPQERPTAREFVRGLQASLITEEQPKPSKSASLRAYLRQQLESQVESNKRDLERDKLFEELVRLSDHTLRESWGELISELGWPLHTRSGGHMGLHARQFRDDWETHSRRFFQGKIGNHNVNIALTYRKKKTPGEPRLIFGITLAVQYGELFNGEYVISSFEREMYMHGPEVEEVKKAVSAFVENDDNKFRVIGRLRELRD